MLELPEEWDYEPIETPKPQTVQTRAELFRGPCDGEFHEIGTVDELSTHISRHTREFVHYYALGNKGGKWFYEHACVEKRRCGR